MLRDVAYLYYEMKLTQQEIADKLFISRTSIGRLLVEAREKGIVEITIHNTFENQQELEMRLKERFNLTDVLVANDLSMQSRESYAAVCQMAGYYLNSQLKPNSVFSMSRGRTVQTVLRYYQPRRTFPYMKLVQLSGIEESEGGIAFEESDLIRFLGERLNCSVYCLHIPAIFETKAMRNMIIGREAVRKVMDMAKDVNFVLMSLTTLAQWKSRLSNREINALARAHAVGNVFGYFYDNEGRIIETDLYDRFVMPDRCIFSAEKRFAVVADLFKAQALYAALNGGLITGFATNTKIARKILALDNKSVGAD